tara:strand:+ start:843 stop:1301 length:459 start_codon:yes stop_codon:yes gene_type:complete
VDLLIETDQSKAMSDIDFSILNFKIDGLQMREIHVHPSIPQIILEYLQHRIEGTVPVLSRLFPDDPCLAWTGCKDADGYAVHWIPKKLKKYGGSTRLARYMYQHSIGIADTNDVDHKCANRACINLRHLRELSPKLNRVLGDHTKLNTEEGS